MEKVGSFLVCRSQATYAPEIIYESKKENPRWNKQYEEGIIKNSTDLRIGKRWEEIFLPSLQQVAVVGKLIYDYTL